MLGLCCFAGFSLVAKAGGLLSSCGVWGSHCGGFFCWGAKWALRCVGFKAAARGLTTSGFWALKHRLSNCGMRS